MPAFKWSELKKEAVAPEHSSGTGSVFRGEKIQVGLVRYPVATEVKPSSGWSIVGSPLSVYNPLPSHQPRHQVPHLRRREPHAARGQ